MEKVVGNLYHRDILLDAYTPPVDTVVERGVASNIFAIDGGTLVHKELDAFHVLRSPKPSIPVNGIHEAVKAHGSFASVEESWLPLKMRFDTVQFAHEAVFHPL